MSLRTSRAALAATCCAALASCTSFDNATQRFAGMLTPYRIEVVQGNFVSREQVEAVKPGMSRAQVRDILGTPLVADVFHGDRWDYIFTIQRPRVEPQRRQLTVYFKGDAVERTVGDTMPSEAEFVSQLDNKRKGAKVPELQASDEALRRQAEASRENAAKPAAAASAAAAPATNYPPLEPPAR